VSLKDPQARKEYNHQYNVDHKENIAAQKKKRRLENPDATKEQSKKGQPRRTKWAQEARRKRGILPKEIKTNLCGHPERKHYGNNMCKSCWRKANYNPEETRSQRQLATQKLKEQLGPNGYAEYIRAQHLRVNYRITPERFEEMKSEQGGKCCCGKELVAGKGTCVDHDHKCCPTGKSCGKCVRGLLCMRCNMVLGLLEENHSLLPLFLSSYLKRYE